MAESKILIPQLRLTIEAGPEANLLNLLVKAKVPLAHSCAGDGVCGTCYLYIEGEQIPLATAAEIKVLKRTALKDPRARIACLVKTPKVPINWVLSTDYW